MKITSQMIIDEYNKVWGEIKKYEPEQLYVYHARNVTHEQIEAYKLQFPEQWKDHAIKLIEWPLMQKGNIVATEIPMKLRGLNLINKK